jgi:hypothetical protein
MNSDTYRDRLPQAAEALGVLGLADKELNSDHLIVSLQLAGAVSGAAEAVAMASASALARKDEIDPIAVIDGVAFRAAGMRGADDESTHAYWVIWLLRRAQAHLSQMLENAASDSELGITGAFFDASHALLSAFVHKRNGDQSTYNACLARARLELEAASAGLHPTP